MSTITGLNHVSLLVSDTTRALDFYCGLLGLEIDTSRPAMAYPGAWLRVAGAQIHLLELPDPQQGVNRPLHGGRDRHVAFNVSDLDAIASVLDAARVAYTSSQSGRRALFCRDPDGNAIELVETAAGGE